MSEEAEEVAQGTSEQGVGRMLRSARESKGLTLDQVAAETRISLRHLQQMEAGSFESLPGRTYAVGFAKTFAKTVGLDPGKIADKVREELELEPMAAQPSTKFEPGDVSRAPSGRLVWFSVFAAILLLAGMFFAGQAIFSEDVEWEPLAAQELAEDGLAKDDAVAEADEAPANAGPVVFTAQEVVWVRFSDAAGLVLKEGELAAGESYTVPADAEGPLVITGRPDLLSITIGGQAVPKLSNEALTVVDVPVSAAALLARKGEDVRSEADGESAAGPAATPSPRRLDRPRPTPSPSAPPADAESVARDPSQEPRFVSRPVVQDVAAAPEEQ